MKMTLPLHASVIRRECLLLFSRLFLILSLCSTFFIGCHSYPWDSERRSAVIPNVQSFEKKKQDAPETEVILTVENRVNKIALSSNRKRLILETRRGVPEESNRVETPTSSMLGVELWNIEFADARQELFSKGNKFLVGTTSGLAAFDEKGERVFWLNQEANPIFLQSMSKDPCNSVIRGAELEGAASLEASDNWVEQPSLRPLPLYLPWKEDEEECEENAFRTDVDFNDLAVEEIQNEIESVDIGVQSLKRDGKTDELQRLSEVFPTSDENHGNLSNAVEKKSEPLEGQLLVEEELEKHSESPNPASEAKIVNGDISDQPYVNVVMTKPLESDAFLLLNPENNDSSGSDVKHLKTSLVTKDAEEVWLSSSSKWLVCHTANETEELPDSSQTFLSSENRGGNEVGTERESEPYSLEWALVPVRDRKRVVRFPDIIQMTFDSSTSDEEIRGRVIDVLAVSDAEDLVATLVEELSQNPRYKIVIWDLNVALKVNLEKVRTPLQAIEVSQIALPYPISRKYCKFSPSGKSIAARIDPHYVTVWQSTNGRLIVEVGEHLGVVHDFEFSPSETKMVVGTGDAVGQVFLWEIRKGVAFQILDNFPHNVKSIDAVAFSSNERFVYFANDQGEIRRWDIRPKVQAFD